jgi:dolichol-phosphate mannosyltransferase
MNQSKLKKACIILPTYNEKDNVGILLPQIFEQASHIGTHELHVLVVDDTSPDGTALVVQDLMRTYPCLHLITGEKKGLGEAYKRGMDHALCTLAPDLIFQMDADLQHSPALIPLFVTLAENGFSLVIGSRFAIGGSTPNFSLRRRTLSRIGNGLLRFLGGLPALRDCTSGYRCIKADLLAKCELGQLSTRGYSFQSSLLFELLRGGARVIEVPIDFPDRQHGASKLSLRDQVEFLLNIFRIRFRKSEEFCKFLLVGGSGVFVNLGLYIAFSRGLNLPLELASALAIELSIISNFVLNNSFTFCRRAPVNGLRNRFLRFHLVAGAAGLVNFGVLLLLAKGWGWWDILANLMGIACATVVNYVLNSRWTWKELAQVEALDLDDQKAPPNVKKF